MRLLTLLLVPAALLAGPSRFARLGEFQGPVEVQLTAADPWIPAERNLPLTELAWLRTGTGARVEIEFDDGSVWRLGANSLGEISDYTRLSTGQRITLLSLDHGTAYYTGQPASKDVTMLVMPGAQMTVLQGSRIRQTAQSGWSQAAVLEGQVRFSSPTAEMDLREGTTARVDPAGAAPFSLYSEIPAEALDRWSEDRDKVQAAPASAAYVNAAYGLADLDSAGQWTPTDSLGIVWKPQVADGWAPYRNGRWRYFDSLGYTWVSDDSWGWLPYHNGRWAREEDLGWVWQPAPTAVFHSGEVYWLRGANFAGWGPLAPGEEWNAPNPGSVTPQGYTSGNTTYASFQPDVRTVDGVGFAAPTVGQLKTAFFVPALPSPAFLSARLDATRPVLQVGSTRVIPSVPGVTFGDAPPTDAPSDLMTNPPVDPPPPPPVADTGATPPPDGVYPVPAAASVTLDAQLPINPSAPDHPSYSHRPAGSGSSGSSSSGSQPTQSSGSTAVGTNAPGTNNPPASNPPASNNGGGKPVHPTDPPPGGTAPTPVGHPVGEPLHDHPIVPPTPMPTPAPPATVPKVASSTTDSNRKTTSPASGEQELHRQVLQDIDPAAPNFTKALRDLNAWSKKFPNSSFENDRLYYYIHVYNGLARADRVLDTAAPLVEAGVRASYRDQQQVLQILVAASASLAKVVGPTREQLATGQKAARELLEFLPDYFAPRRKPSDVSSSAWSIAKGQLEDVARQALAHRPATHTAAAN
jgi:hypothetical protein